MAIGNYNYLTPDARLDKIGELLAKGVYLCHRENTDETKKLSKEKEVAPVPKTKYRKNVNLALAINLDERIFTIEETTSFLRISRTTLWRLRKQGKLPYCIVGNKLIRFKLSEVLNYLGNLRA